MSDLLARIRSALAATAGHTPGPWERFKWGDGSEPNRYQIGAPEHEVVVAHDTIDPDAALIVAAPDLRALLSEAMEAVAAWNTRAPDPEVARLREALAGIIDVIGGYSGTSDHVHDRCDALARAALAGKEPPA